MEEGKQSRHSLRQRPSPSLVAMTLAYLLICVCDALILRRETMTAAGLDYLCNALTLIGCAVAFYRYSQSSSRRLRLRGLLMSAAVSCAAVGYFVSFVECCWPPSFSTRIFQVLCFTASEWMYLLAAVLFFSSVVRSVVLLDMLQTLLFVLLRFYQTYSPTTFDHFTVDHLLLAQLVALFFFLVAVFACFGAASRAESIFLQALSWFFGLRSLSFFLSNQVSYTWLGHHQCSLWDLPTIVLTGGFALYLAYFVPSMDAATVRRTRPSPIVRNLMPSFLAVVNVTLGLHTMHTSPKTGSAILALAVVFYVARTALFQGQTATEHAALQTHNEHLQSLTARDPLTGIGNRRSLVNCFEQLQASGVHGEMALLLMDIDHFKQANDRFGHIHGDNVLIALARELDSISLQIPGGHCARYGGDEFALLLPETDLEHATILAEKLRFAFASHRFQAAESTATLSVGVAVCDAAEPFTLEELVASADDALYQAKIQGRNCVAAA